MRALSRPREDIICIPSKLNNKQIMNNKLLYFVSELDRELFN